MNVKLAVLVNLKGKDSIVNEKDVEREFLKCIRKGYCPLVLTQQLHAKSEELPENVHIYFFRKIRDTYSNLLDTWTFAVYKGSDQMSSGWIDLIPNSYTVGDQIADDGY